MQIDDDGPVEMKFVIKGRTFDTATSNVVAIDRGIAMRANRLGDHEKRYESVLYRTAKGTFFLHDHSTVKYLQGGKPVTEDDAEDLTPEQAIEWIENHGAVVMNDEGLALPPEA